MRYCFILLLIFSFKATADNENYTVKRVGAHAQHGWIYIEVDRLPKNYECGGDIKEFVWEIHNPVANNIMSIALSALVSNKTLRIRHDTGDCVENYPSGSWAAILQ
ncbi:hypothetical protein [Photobacterium rosenbergii]|uniref:Uncharacterized protein n=1 Tax=Photobacterium rosenbergii TaxID=294936 RepID=A0ABU3ZE04_9GAMM|nr:hypothetical protein [Photobacterium rosenbergii]MDV5168334.1 hypothetical protein [Photobacterium rosenbergii]